LRKQLRPRSVSPVALPPDLHARSTGVVRRRAITSKIVFHTFPGTSVPAHLYVPESLSGAAPAILFYTGHWWPDSKTYPDFQAFCINMARLGFVVFVFDAFGQGERGISQRDHRRTEALLVGISQQGLAEYETLCTLAYLLGGPGGPQAHRDDRRIGRRLQHLDHLRPGPTDRRRGAGGRHQ
jgi:hypothetical protein